MTSIHIPEPTKQRVSLGDVLALLVISSLIPLIGIASTWEVWQ